MATSGVFKSPVICALSSCYKEIPNGETVWQLRPEYLAHLGLGDADRYFHVRCGIRGVVTILAERGLEYDENFLRLVEINR